MMFRQSLTVMLGIFLLAITMDKTIAQSTPIQISQPVQGQVIFHDRAGQIFLADTFTGQSSVVVSSNGNGSVSNVVLSPQGDQLTYLGQGDIDSIIFNLSNSSTTEVEMFPGREGIFYPLSWVGDAILYKNPVLGAPNTGNITLNLMDTQTTTITEILRYNESAVISDLPLPSGVNQFKFSDIRNASLNPIYPDWVLLQLAGTDPTQSITDKNGIRELIVGINVIWNRLTDEKLSLDNLLPRTIDQSSTLSWHPDGNYLLIPSSDSQGFYVEIVHFTNSPTARLDNIRQSQNSQMIVLDWLGISDLLIAYDLSSTDSSANYQIAQIVHGTLYSTDFFQIPTTPYPVALWADWSFAANQEEQHQLSCLFDQALQARINVGERARVNFTNGTPLRLRTEPNVDATAILQMAEGTEFDVIGGCACVNGTDYYRFWQLELDDGIIGWAAESSTTDYFIEPLPTSNGGADQITSTQSPSAISTDNASR